MCNALSETRAQIEKDLEVRQACALLTECCLVLARDHDRRPVDQIAQINSDWSHGCCVTQSESNCMRKVVQFIRTVKFAMRRIEASGRQSWICGLEHRVRRRPAKGHSASGGVRVPTVIEEGSPRPDPTNGSRSRKCSSWLMTKSACPPTGNPVMELRGPAWFKAKPLRFEPPPLKSLSGSGMTSGGGVVVGAGKVSDTVLA